MPRPQARIEAKIKPSGFIDMVDTFDRPEHAHAEFLYAEAGTYEEDGHTYKPMKRIPKAGAYARAGVGRARAEFSVYEAEAKGPNASVVAEASLSRGLTAMAGAELGSAAMAAGPLKVKAGLAIDTGVSAGLDGVEVKFLGTGLRVGPNPEIALLGNAVECSVM